ncbi:helix-turn-helix domain-containing protein [Bradyrhizobium sp. AUGA SZCCT0240]|uniref:helix-turn-helix domain-containing protein n=1 Tax=Bradyrhizobium sp. AUGA SZCCT0240 TaxID=2807669 RepID=UPI00289EF1A0|nr:helix-turn-helix domain-containing protein [Bradyrhizobium sp. AUGA SZCCT0240]
MSLPKVKTERLDQTGRRDAEALARQLSKISSTRSADVKVQGVMLKLLRELTELVSKHPGIAIVPIDRELSPADAGEILGISRPTVVRLMEAGKLPFRFEGKHHRCKLEDVLRLKAAGEPRPLRDRKMSKREVEELVLGTTNAPYKRSITATELSRGLTSGRSEPWTVHVATFFTDVKPEMILKFAEMHGISKRVLASAYRAMRAATGEANPALEAVFDKLASATEPNHHRA